jgi:hypothetical protein
VQALAIVGVCDELLELLIRVVEVQALAEVHPLRLQRAEETLPLRVAGAELRFAALAAAAQG